MGEGFKGKNKPALVESPKGGPRSGIQRGELIFFSKAISHNVNQSSLSPFIKIFLRVLSVSNEPSEWVVNPFFFACPVKCEAYLTGVFS
jgi:hypothetical protein